MKKLSQRRKPKKKEIIVSSVAVMAAISFLCFIYLVWPKFDTSSILHVKVVEGMRKEEVAKAFGDALGWSDHDRQHFIANDPEGFNFPTSYDIPAHTTPAELINTFQTTFNTNVIENQKKLKNHEVDIHTIINIASIIEREAYNKRDMNIISGIIWNRLNKGMKLEMDATLQYAVGSSSQWWPVIHVKDRTVASDYNTYLHPGLPPTPIANPSYDAIAAALNPTKTSAMFYIHDTSGYIHPAVTYSQHLANIQVYLK